MASLMAWVVRGYARAVIKRNQGSPQAMVQHMRRVMQGPAAMQRLLPLGVRREPWRREALAGVRLTVAKPTRAILYLHGGGHVAGSPRVYHPLAGRLAKALRAEVVLPDYRLAPEHPFPADLEDAVVAYEGLLAQGWSPSRIVVMGDSAGGGLSLALLLALRERRRPLPAAAVAFSPFADKTEAAVSLQAHDRSDAMLSGHMIRCANVSYLQGRDSRQPLASPALADYRGLPPLWLSVCEDEVLRDDGLAVAARARAAGGEVELVRRADLVHVWPIFYPWLPEARADVAQVVAFIRRWLP